MISIGKPVIIIGMSHTPQTYPVLGVLPVWIILKQQVLRTAVLCLCSAIGLTAVLWAGHTVPPADPAFAPANGGPVVWVIDPGHGGEDGGAVSTGGVEESHVNLEVSLRLNELLRFAGQRTAMTRREDVSVCDAGLDTIRARKASDIRNRVALVNETEGAVLVSIHQNSLPSSPETHGAQVFRNREEGGELLAEIIQNTLNETINTHRAKEARIIPKTIYLMNHVTAPAVLVECGFLSNETEAARLTEGAYQTKLAAVITAGCLRALAGEDAP